MSGGRRVVVTGLGIVSPIGNTVADAWAGLLAGRTGAAPISRFDASGFPVRFACEVKDFDATDHVQSRTARRMDRCAHLAVAAARQAEQDGGLNVRAVGARAGSAIGSALGGVESFEQTVRQLVDGYLAASFELKYVPFRV